MKGVNGLRAAYGHWLVTFWGKWKHLDITLKPWKRYILYRIPIAHGSPMQFHFSTRISDCFLRFVPYDVIYHVL